MHHMMHTYDSAAKLAESEIHRQDTNLCTAYDRVQAECRESFSDYEFGDGGQNSWPLTASTS